MQQLVKIFAGCTLLFPLLAYANAQQELQQRLNKINSFQAYFQQKVISAEGQTIQKSNGELWIKRPNLFKWHTFSPDETLFVSDGKTVWFYNPFVDEVTINWLDKVAKNTPFMLIARNSPQDWQQYNVSQQGNQFTLIPDDQVSGALKQFSITVTTQGKIEGFIAVEQDGQHINYILTDQQVKILDKAFFDFVPPKGVSLDDQRSPES